MEHIKIRAHPPWYARGTPVINTRDGPPMALSDKPLFAIREGPLARGKPGEEGRPESEVERSKIPTDSVGDGRPETHDRSRGNPRGKTRRWLTLKTTFFNTQNSVYSQCYGVLGRKMVVIGKPPDVGMPVIPTGYSQSHSCHPEGGIPMYIGKRSVTTELYNNRFLSSFGMTFASGKPPDARDRGHPPEVEEVGSRKLEDRSRKSEDRSGRKTEVGSRDRAFSPLRACPDCSGARVREGIKKCVNAIMRECMNEGKEGLCGGSPFRAGVRDGVITFGNLHLLR